ncbi:hypothetical protein BKA67DRAFT_533049 [Truncatella angustata]|uniref:Uncharacterized protein n=1 Tax=Truncatella angustata TaxID=152316 RepID=A0A9P8UTM9_9PEZI|nr:uncharacterized protein BKA67DRAFT_533049 [Truncatella angustata]KAH6657862.1 hypothetical protein BKA67DRAFT_533049 [Truncatella angustata]KAH8197094.1 hypothetical protein TruAng_008733 [Truncatella angustata]
MAHTFARTLKKIQSTSQTTAHVRRIQSYPSSQALSYFPLQYGLQQSQQVRHLSAWTHARTSRRTHMIGTRNIIPCISAYCQHSSRRSKYKSAGPLSKRYRRLRVDLHNEEDFTYPLIASYVQNPSLASTVEEFVIDEHSYPGSYGTGEDNLWRPIVGPIAPETSCSVPRSAHDSIVAYIKSLGLGDATADQMIQAFEWKRRKLSGPLCGGHRTGCSGLDELRDLHYVSAATVILLALCENIRILYMGGVRHETPLHQFLLKNNYELLHHPVLRNVKCVEIIPSCYTRWNYDGVYYDLEFMEYFKYFHRLPNLHTVTMEGIGEYQAESCVFPPATSNLKKLHIGHTDMSSWMFRGILSIPKALEELSISEGGFSHMDGGNSILYPKHLRMALLEHRETLRVLDLDLGRCLPEIDSTWARNAYYNTPASSIDHGHGSFCAEVYQEYQDDEYFRLDLAKSKRPLYANKVPDTQKYGYTIGSLHDFISLTHLSINFRLLFGPSKEQDNENPALYLYPNPIRRLAEEPTSRLIDTLPPNLEYLCLYNYNRGENRDIDEQVEELMEKRNGRLPKLLVVKGVEEEVVGVTAQYDDEIPEGEHWERPEVDLSCVEV